MLPDDLRRGRPEIETHIRKLLSYFEALTRDRPPKLALLLLDEDDSRSFPVRTKIESPRQQLPIVENADNVATK